MRAARLAAIDVAATAANCAATGVTDSLAMAPTAAVKAANCKSVDAKDADFELLLCPVEVLKLKLTLSETGALSLALQVALMDASLRVD